MKKFLFVFLLISFPCNASNFVLYFNNKPECIVSGLLEYKLNEMRYINRNYCEKDNNFKVQANENAFMFIFKRKF